MNSKYTNGQEIDQVDNCPVHGTEIRKVYEFGRYRDAEVYVYSGCKCACTLLNDGFGGSVHYHDDYTSAAGQATMRVKMANARGY